MKQGMPYFAGGVGVGILVTAFWRYPPHSSSDWAAWVQALGSIAAIFWAGVFARNQLIAQRALQEQGAKEARSQRLESFIALCDVAMQEVQNAYQHAKSSPDEDTDTELSISGATAMLNYALVVYAPRTFDDLRSVLNAFPIHELPNAASVGTAQRFRDGFMHVSNAISRWADKIRSMPPQFSDDDEANDLCEAAEYLGAQFRNLNKQLNDYVNG